jgi:hypothetical protein
MPTRASEPSTVASCARRSPGGAGIGLAEARLPGYECPRHSPGYASPTGLPARVGRRRGELGVTVRVAVSMRRPRDEEAGSQEIFRQAKDSKGGQEKPL